ncbi:MAG: hypothetical protein HZA10_00335 [Nitrospirae bacterium]|nr:hypothetical protein [Nitrospirota bacterium]
MKKTVYSLFLLIIFMTALYAKVEAASQTWQQVPLRTQAQENEGMSGGEGMQMVWGLSYAPSNPYILYLVSNTSQVWKSKDGGNTWQMKHKGFLANGGISLAVHPNNENIVFVAGSSYQTESNEIADGIYRTQDGGESWNRVYPTHFYSLGAKKGGVNFAFAGANTIYAGTHEEGLLKSIDGGDTWSPLNILSGTKILDVKVNPQNSSIIFLATENGLYKVTDNGTVTLEPIGTDLPIDDFPRAIVVNPNNPNIIYVTVGTKGVYKSTDGGNSFSPKNTGLSPVNQGKKATYLAMSSKDPNYLYVSFYMLGGNHPYYTHNGGENWYKPSTMDNGSLIYEVNDSQGGEYYSTPIATHPGINPDNEKIAITSGAGNHLEKTTNGGDTWTYSGNGYTGGRAGVSSTSFSWDSNNPNRFALFLMDFGPVLTEDGGSTFKNLKIPRYTGVRTTPVGALDPTPNSNVIVTAVGGWTNQVIAVTQDGGQNWTLMDGTNGKQYTEDNYNFIAFHPQNPNIVYAGKYKSTDKGNNWSELSKKVVAMFQGDASDENIIYAADMNGFILTLSKSTDGGTNWISYDSVDIGTSGPGEIFIDPKNPDRIYVTGLWEGVHIWNGSTWDLKTCGGEGNLETDAFGTCSTRYITVDPKHPNVVYAGKWINFYGHSNGIFRSINYGDTWENITYNLGPEFTPWSISVNPHNGYVYVGSSHGTWRLPPTYTDNDGDGYAIEDGFGPVDCNDSNPSINPGAAEIPNNNIDDDCNPATPVLSVSGNAYNYPIPFFRATLAVNVNASSLGTSYVRYYYTRTRMNFASTAISGITVSNGIAAVTGTGTVNGTAGYTFTATITDGSPDAIGVQIKKSDGTLYYNALSKAVTSGNFTVTGE